MQLIDAQHSAANGQRRRGYGIGRNAWLRWLDSELRRFDIDFGRLGIDLGWFDIVR